jgi:chemotaxis signal transduction protein
MKSLPLVRCWLGNQSYALDMSRVRNIVRADRLRRQPGPHHQVGSLIHAAGETPVHDLAERLGVETLRRPALQYAVIIDADPPFALLVDRVSQIMRVPATALRPLPRLVQDNADGIEGVVVLDQEFILQLALQRPGSAKSPRPDPGPRRFTLPTSRTMKHRQLVLVRTYEAQPDQRPISLGFSVRQVIELQGWSTPLPVPGTTALVLGLILWREQPIAVMDLNARLGLPTRGQDEQSRLMLALPAGTAEPIAIPVLPPTRVVRLPIPHLACERDLGLPARYVRQAWELHGETTLMPNLDLVTGSK